MCTHFFFRGINTCCHGRKRSGNCDIVLIMFQIPVGFDDWECLVQVNWSRSKTRSAHRFSPQTKEKNWFTTGGSASPESPQTTTLFLCLCLTTDVFFLLHLANLCFRNEKENLHFLASKTKNEKEKPPPSPYVFVLIQPATTLPTSQNLPWSFDLH